MTEPRLARRRDRRPLRGVAAVVVVGVLGAGGLAGALWLEHRSALTLPALTGPFAVGRALQDWVVDASPGPLAPRTGATRELLVWIWYPTVPRSGAVPADYLPAPMRAAVVRARGALISTFLTRDLSKVRAHSVRDSDVSPRQRAYPVVILRGGASAEVWNYTTLAEDLASHGYVVVGFDAPYRSNVVAFPDGRVMRRRPENDPERAAGAADSAERINRVLVAWTGDIASVLDRLQRLNATGADAQTANRFTGRLDLSRVGVVGHSLGGATAAQFCHDDARCTAGIDIDGALVGSVVRDGIRRPFMFLMGDHSRESNAESRPIMSAIQSVYDRLPPDGRRFVTIPGANHFLFSDDGALLKSHLVLRALRLLGVVGIDGRNQLAVTAETVRDFFDSHLTGGRRPT